MAAFFADAETGVRTRVRVIELQEEAREALSIGPWVVDPECPPTQRRESRPYEERWLRLYLTTLRWMIADPHTGWLMKARLWITWALLGAAMWISSARCGQRRDKR